MDIDDGQGNGDFPFIMADDPLLETGVEGDGDASIIRDVLAINLANGLLKFPSP